MESWVSSEHRIALAIKVSTWRSNSQSHIQQAGAPGTLVGAAKCTAAIRLSDSGRIPIEGPSQGFARYVSQNDISVLRFRTQEAKALRMALTKSSTLSGLGEPCDAAM